MRKLVLLVAAVTVIGAQPVWAARTVIHEAAESQEYRRKMGGMIGRGLLNGATCFVDVIVNVVNETKVGPPLVGTLTGAAKGAGCALLRLGSGVIDVLTFWVPGFNGLPVSDSYDNCLAVGSPSASLQELPPTSGESDFDLQAPAAPSEPTPAAPPVAEPAKKQWSK